MDWGNVSLGNDTECGDNISAAMCLLAGNATASPRDVSYLGFMEGSRFLVQRVIVPFVVLVGVLGNVATMVVLTRRRMRSSTNVYLTALAASDLLYLLFLFSLSLAHYELQGALADAYWTYWRFGLYFIDATSSTSIWLTVTFTVERYIAVCHPLRGKMLCTEPRARKVTALVWLLCFLSTASTPFEWKTILVPVKLEQDSGNVTDTNMTAPEKWRVSVAQTELGQLYSYRTIFYWFSSIVYVFLPLLLLVVFNVFLILAVHRSQKQRRRLTQSERRQRTTSSSGAESTAQQENKITVTLIAVVVLFLVCQSPTAVTLIYSSLSEEPVKDSAKYHIMRGLGNIFNLLVAVNAACNFILYCALSDKYRRTFAMTFLPRRCWARRDRRNTCTVMGATTYQGESGDITPAIRSRSPSIFRDSNDSVTTEYVPIPLNGRGSNSALLKRHQSAYLPRQTRGGSSGAGRGVTRSKSLLGRAENEVRSSKRQSPQHDSLLVSSEPSSPRRSESLSLLQRWFRFRLPGRSRRRRGSKAILAADQRITITVSDCNSSSDTTGLTAV